MDSKITSEQQIVKDSIQQSAAIQQAGFADLNAHMADFQHTQSLAHSSLQGIKSGIDDCHAQSQNRNTIQHMEIQKEIKTLRKTVTQLTRRITSRPGALSEFRDVTEAFNLPPSTSGREISHHAPDSTPISLRCKVQHTDELICSLLGTRPVCTCQSNRKSCRRNVKLRGFSLFSEKVEEQHTPGCPRSKNTTQWWKWRGGMIAPSMLQGILKLGVHVSCTMAYGTEGFGLSSQLVFFPTVNGDTDPAFRVLTLVRNAAYQCVCELHRPVPKERGWEEFIALATAKIIFLLESGRASPRAVDSHNQTLTHYAAAAIERFSWFSHIPRQVGKSQVDPLRRMLKTLMNYNLPAAVYDLHNTTPLGVILSAGLRMTPATLEILEDLFAADPAITVPDDDASGRGWAWTLQWTYGISDAWDILRYFPTVAIAFGCGPLSLATLSHNLKDVERLLTNYPRMLKEQNMLRQTPLHLAAGNAECLALVMRSAEKSMLNKLSRFGYTTLAYALILSGKTCRTGKSVRKCSNCHCAEPAVLLMKVMATSLDFFKYNQQNMLQTVLDCASERCKRRYISYLARARLDLTKIALRHLGATEISSLEIEKDKVIDTALPHILSSLEKRGVDLPFRLLPAISQMESGRAFTSIYRGLSDPHCADLAYSKGFRDITQVLWWKDLQERNIYMTPKQHLTGFLYIQWLGNHGADLVFSPVEVERRLFGGHLAFAMLKQIFVLEGTSPGTFKKSWWLHSQTWFRSLVEKAVLLLPEELLSDNCECPCSLHHCSPLVCLFTGRDHFYLRNGGW
ncbi:hypothetical protein QBC35DRAFT_231632 [Podospora australis]|uniref:Ankyrin repeat protein n=1 Tax=Podospora australis TaxID=1536484 RepID=A0AAN6WUF3_9PEZI|nr:hypothetical protein QBC35DRAFT_231632 [Podospora australis]